MRNISKAYLERLFVPVALMKQSYKDLATFPFFEVQDFGPKNSTIRVSGPAKKKILDNYFYISFDKIENPAAVALESATDMLDVILAADWYETF